MSKPPSSGRCRSYRWSWFSSPPQPVAERARKVTPTRRRMQSRLPRRNRSWCRSQAGASPPTPTPGHRRGRHDRGALRQRRGGARAFERAPRSPRRCARRRASTPSARRRGAQRDRPLTKTPVKRPPAQAAASGAGRSARRASGTWIRSTRRRPARSRPASHQSWSAFSIRASTSPTPIWRARSTRTPAPPARRRRRHLAGVWANDVIGHGTFTPGSSAPPRTASASSASRPVSSWRWSRSRSTTSTIPTSVWCSPTRSSAASTGRSPTTSTYQRQPDDRSRSPRPSTTSSAAISPTAAAIVQIVRTAILKAARKNLTLVAATGNFFIDLANLPGRTRASSARSCRFRSPRSSA